MLWLFSGIVVLAVLFFLTTFVCFRMAFYSPKRKPLGDDEYDLPDGEIYEEYRESLISWMKMARSTPHENVSIRSFDGLTLRGRYYEYAAGALTEILIHGYRGSSERDISAGIERCFALGRNALLVDQRASGRSDGGVITFGINEHRDCLEWVSFLVDKLGGDCQIILTGISMGAATVAIAAGEKLPPNVVCVLADCGFTSAKEIMKKVIREMKLPPALAYPFVRWGAKIYGGFDLEKTSPIEAVRRATVPVIFIHGDADAFVPSYMSEELFAACASQKKLVLIKGAGHGLAFPVDRELYISSLRDFQDECGF